MTLASPAKAAGYSGCTPEHKGCQVFCLSLLSLKSLLSLFRLHPARAYTGARNTASISGPGTGIRNATCQ